MLNIKQQLQFELWEECNSRCSFCYLGNNARLTPDDQKIKNIEQTIKKISDLNIYKDINCLAYIGGEFFQGQLKNNDVKLKFIELMKYTNKLLNSRTIDTSWITASLLIGDQRDLYDILNLFDDLSKIWICTSYDTYGRFHSQKEKNNWIRNLEKLRYTFPTLNINITTIVTGDFIEKYLNDDLEIMKIANRLKCAQFLKPVCRVGCASNKKDANSLVPNFFPKRNMMLKFLNKYRLNESEYMYDKLFNINYRADYLQTFGHRDKFSHRIKNEYKEAFDDSILTMKCGHGIQYQCYIDSDECLICDKNKIKKII